MQEPENSAPENDEATDGRYAGPVLVLVNPAAGKGAGRAAFPRLRELISRSCSNAEIFLSQEPGFAARLLSGLSLAPGTIVIAAGGDGTVHEVGVELIGKEDLSLGVIPIGSGNDIGSQLGMPTEPGAALTAILAGTPLPWDAGTIGDFTFLNSVGFGLSAQTCYWSHSTGRLRGFARYGLAAARAWWHHRSMKMSIDGMEASGERYITLMEIAIGNRVGGGFKLTPKALVDDGLLDVCMMDAASRLQILPLSPKGRAGKHLDHSHVHYEQLAAFRLKVERDEQIHVDGEMQMLSRGEHSVRVKPRALKMIVASSHPRLIAE